MHKAIPIASLLASLTSLLCLGGCVSPGQTMLPRGELSMAQIYDHQASQPADRAVSSWDTTRFQGARYAVNVRPTVARGGASVKAHASTSRAQFQLLPNPVVPLTVFPHLAEGQTPVPGYQTAFFVYDKKPICTTE